MKLTKIFILAAMASLFVSSAQAQEKLGIVKAFLVKGNVTLISPAGQSMPLKRGQEFREGSTVVTGGASSALLIFSNGSTLNVTPDSKITISQFQQAAYDPALGSFLRLKEDPSTSNMQADLAYGKVNGEVRRLGPGSQFMVSTPVGSAGIRGTTFSISYNPNSGMFSVNVLTGTVVVSSPAGTQTVTTGQSTTVAPGGGPITIQAIDGAEAAELEQVAQQISQVEGFTATVTNTGTIVITPDSTVITEESSGQVVSGSEIGG